MNSKMTDDAYLYAWKKSGQSDETIAAKLSISPQEVKRRFIMVEQAVKEDRRQQLGVDMLVQQFNTLCLQYQMVGESLKAVAGNLSNLATPQEVRDKLADGDDATVESLMSSFIILRPWIVPGMVEEKEIPYADEKLDE